MHCIVHGVTKSRTRLSDVRSLPGSYFIDVFLTGSPGQPPSPKSERDAFTGKKYITPGTFHSLLRCLPGVFLHQIDCVVNCSKD